MSKFWEAGSSSDEEGGEQPELEDGFSEEESEEEEGGEKPQEEQNYDWSSSEDSGAEDKKREVRSARVKRYEEMNKLLEKLRGWTKNQDWDKIWEDFQALSDWIKKAKNIISQDGVPGLYIEMLCTLEDLVNTTAKDKAGLKSMNKLKAKAFNAMKHQLPKHNQAYTALMKRWREDPSSFQVLEEKIKEKEGPKPTKKQKWGDTDSEDSDVEVTEKPKPVVQDKEDWVTVTRPTKVVKKQPEQIEWNDGLVMEKLREIQKSYGKKKTDAKQQIVSLHELYPHAQATQPKVEIYKQIIASMFGMTYTNLTKNMKRELWNDCLKRIKEMLKLITDDPSFKLSESVEGAADDSETIVLSMRAFVEQLDAEFTKSLQNIDPHTHEYVERLRDESSLLELCITVQRYYENLGDLKQAARMAMKRVEHIYYKLDTEREKLEEAHHGRKGDDKGDKAQQPDDLEQLCVLIYKHGDEILRTRAMLCHVFHHAIHDRYHHARDILLVTHIQDNVQQMDVTTQILYNRALAQLGLCAFRTGMITETFHCLSDLCSGKTREHLAQGVSTHGRYGDKNVEQEKLEKQRQIPYHMHLSLELLEAVHLISAMLIEVPNMAAHPFDKPKGMSRFRKLLDLFERQVFTGPPETTRDFVITAAKALSKGDWKKCEALLLNLPVWDLVHSVDQVKAMLRSKIQEAGLRTYLFTYSKHYNSLSFETLCQMFDLPHATANSIVSKMIFNDELHASLDQPTKTIVMHRVEPSKLQYLAIQYAERMGTFVENNELILDARTGCYGNKLDQAKPQKGDMRGRKPYGRGGFRQKGPYTPGQRSQQGGAGGSQGQDRGQQQRRQNWNQRSGGKDQNQDGYQRYIQRKAV